MEEVDRRQNELHELARVKGWWAPYSSGEHSISLTADELLSKLALIHSEVSESVECVRHGQLNATENEDGKPEGLPSELADVMIRCYDLAGALGFSLDDAIDVKHAYNRTRPYRHGGKKA